MTSAPADAEEQLVPTPTVPTLVWELCGEDLPGIECALATVPLDYDEPDGATNRIGTVFINPGGPGGSGIELLVGDFGPFLADGLDGRFDVVGFDPRGVGASDPLRCFDSQEQQTEFFATGIPLFPYERSHYRPFYDRYRSLVDECFAGGESIARHLSTADVARDLDLLREAVGDAQLSRPRAVVGRLAGPVGSGGHQGRVRRVPPVV